MTEINSLSKEQVLHLAKLSRLSLTPEEVGRFSGELTKVVEYITKLNQLPTVAVKNLVASPVLYSRLDKVEQVFIKDDLLKQAPQVKNDLIEVPAVFDRNEDI